MSSIERRRPRRLINLGATLLVAGFSACSASPSPATDAAPDVIDDRADAPLDVAADTAADQGADVAADVTGDVVADAEADAVADAAGDVAADVVPDDVSDAAVGDASERDVAADAPAMDVGGDAVVMDVVTDAGADAGADGASGRCVRDSDCSSTGRVCNTTSGLCVGCVTDANCATGQVCASDATCRARVCTAGALSCQSTTARQVCNPDGLGYTPTACATGESCQDGICRAARCTPGTTTCLSLRAKQICGSDGMSYTTIPCGATESCQMGVCLPWRCAPGAASCASLGDRQVCNDDGLGVSTTRCGASETCVGGVCRAWTCTPEMATCTSGSAASVCNDDGLSSRTVVCGGTSTCTGSRCSGWTCVPGEASCASATERRVCGPEGLYSTTSTCPVPAHAATSRCDRAACAFTCAAGFGDCNGTAADGCEVDVSADGRNCGGCGVVCPTLTNGSSTCNTSRCRTQCNTGYGDCNGSITDGCEAVLATDARNCGGCGIACAAGQSCAMGACTRCAAVTAPRVLIYGDTADREAMRVPTGAVVTQASATRWATLTTTDFASYNLILVSDLYTTGTAYQVLIDTRDRWAPAVTGRVFLSGLDATARTPGDALARAALAWASTGPGTGLYVGGAALALRGADITASLGGFGGFTITTDSVNVTVPTHASLGGATSASLSGWMPSARYAFVAWPSAYTPVAANATNPSQRVILVRDASCTP